MNCYYTPRNAVAYRGERNVTVEEIDESALDYPVDIGNDITTACTDRVDRHRYDGLIGIDRGMGAGCERTGITGEVVQIAAV